MTRTLQLADRAPISYDSALDTESNIVEEVKLFHLTKDLYSNIREQRDVIAALTKHHLGLQDTDTCTVVNTEKWLRGCYNVCVPVVVVSGTTSFQVIFRIPMPHKLAEAQCPGTTDEKVRCEVGTYIYMQENCPDVRIPFLYGFGFSTHRHFTHECRRPQFVRLFHTIKRSFYRLLGYSNLSRYTVHQSRNHAPFSYTLLEYISSNVGEMLSETWDKFQDDTERRRRLYGGIARIMLSLARIPQPAIGSFQFRDDCSVTLTNRPLTGPLIRLENSGTPRTIQTSDIYSTTDSYVSDMLTHYDNSFLTNPNATFCENDCRNQMAGKTILRALSHHFIKREYRHGPFFMQLTDFHTSNIFVDEDWNIRCMLDLDFVNALPREYMSTPYWFAHRFLNQIDGDLYDRRRQEFAMIFVEEERNIGQSDLPLSKVMEEMWNSRGLWFWYCLRYVNSMDYITTKYLCPKFSINLEQESSNVLSKLWCKENDDIVKTSIENYCKYERDLIDMFS